MCLGCEGRLSDAVLVDTVEAAPDGRAVAFWRTDMVLPVTGGTYRCGGETHAVAACDGPLRLAYVSCNGKEDGDFDRPEAERAAMWHRLGQDHLDEPFALMLCGGDQIYADEGLQAHPDLARWAEADFEDKPGIAVTAEMEAALVAFFLTRWTQVVTADGAARLYAEVPSLSMWDDHDIFDGWGSWPDAVQKSPVARLVFRVARRFFRLFQAGGHDAGASGLSFARRYPGFTILGPDLRSDRTRTRVMGETAWRFFEEALETAPDGPVLVMSSVPALGPRLSLLERLYQVVPGMQKYEDDLRDQWQSLAHREEWKRFLRAMARRATSRGPVVVVSGEIHLATRGEMVLSDGRVLHQLTSSGISHPAPPKAFARALGLLASFGEAPLPEMPIRLLPVPGQRWIYTAERNYMTLARQEGWSARWSLEHSGLSPALPLCP